MKLIKKGFTLVELLVVVIILAVLASIAVGVVPAATRRAKLASFATTLSTVQSAVDRFYAEANKYPCAEQPADAPQLIDFAATDGVNAFIGGYLQFEPNANAADLGLNTDNGDVVYYISTTGRVFAYQAGADGTVVIASDTIVYTQDDVSGKELKGSDMGVPAI